MINCIKADYYHTSGGAISNFADKLPSPQSELAQAITKETYDFGFLTLEEGNHPNWSAACQNVRRALTGKWSEMYFLPRTGESMVMKILQEVNPE